jgi:ATP-dependent 26S proteasome regulatory subunit
VREEILRAQLTDRANSLTGKHMEYVARATEGMVAADIRSIVTDAAWRSAFGRVSLRIKWEDMHDAVEDAIRPSNERVEQEYTVPMVSENPPK